MKKRFTIISVFLLCSFSITSIILRNSFIVPAAHEEDSVYKIRHIINTSTKKAGAVLRIALPYNTDHIRIYSQHFDHPNFKFQPLKIKDKSRDLVFISTKIGKSTLVIEFDALVSTKNLATQIKQQKKLNIEDRAQYLSAEDSIPIDTPELIEILKNLGDETSSEESLIHAIFEYVSKNSRKNIKILNAQHNALISTRLMVSLLRTIKLPARVVTGFILSEGTTIKPHYWVEVFYAKSWKTFDPLYNFEQELPINYLPMDKNSQEIYKSSKSIEVLAKVEILKQSTSSSPLQTEDFKLIDILKLSRLPLDMQNILGILLLLPLGVLVTTFAVNILGIRTYGTFGPTLLALSFAVVDITTAILILVVVAIIGATGRSVLPMLYLTRTPRLTIVFTLVALAITLGSSIKDYLGIGSSEIIILLPTVVLTNLVDRFYTVADDDGIYNATRRLFWTILISIAVTPIFMQQDWGQWLLVYPETHAFTIAVTIMLSQYKGRKLFSMQYLNLLQEKKRENSTRESAN